MKKDSSPVSEPIKSTYDASSGKKAKSIADLRSALKKMSEKSDAGEASPTGSEGGQDKKHASSKNNFGKQKKAGMGKMDMASKKSPRAAASMEGDIDDPITDDMEDSGMAEEGMTPKGKSRKGNAAIKRVKAMVNDDMPQ